MIMNDELVVHQLAKIKECAINTIQNTKFCLILQIEPIALEDGSAWPHGAFVYL